MVERRKVKKAAEETNGAVYWRDVTLKVSEFLRWSWTCKDASQLPTATDDVNCGPPRKRALSEGAVEIKAAERCISNDIEHVKDSEVDVG